MIRVTSCCVLLQLYLYYISFLLQTHLPKTLNLQTRERAKWIVFYKKVKKKQNASFLSNMGLGFAKQKPVFHSRISFYRGESSCGCLWLFLPALQCFSSAAICIERKRDGEETMLLCGSVFELSFLVSSFELWVVGEAEVRYENPSMEIEAFIGKYFLE